MSDNKTVKKLHIHQIWIQGEPPQRYAQRQHSWRKYQSRLANQNLQVFHWTWSGAQIRALIQKHYPEALHHYDNYPKVVQQADMGRVAILLVHGGIFVDMDVSCFRPLPNAIHSKLTNPTTPQLVLSESCLRFGVGRYVYAAIKNCVVGTSNPAHPYLTEVLQEMLQRDPTNKNVYNTTGPSVWNEVFWRNKYNKDRTVNVLQSYVLAPSTYVYNPTTFLQSGRATGSIKTRYGVGSHEGEMSWCSPIVRKYAKYSINAALVAGIVVFGLGCKYMTPVKISLATITTAIIAMKLSHVRIRKRSIVDRYYVQYS